jgi:hypothetical protein
MNDEKKLDLKFFYNNVIQPNDYKLASKPLKKIKTFVENPPEEVISPSVSPKKGVRLFYLVQTKTT